MMATVESVARIAITEAQSDASALFAARYVDLRWKELATRFRFKHLKDTGELQLIPRYNTGTATATRDSRTVTGTTTVWTPAMEGRYFRGREAWYRIAQVASNTSLLLTTPFSENTLTAGAYDIVQRYYALPRTVKHVGRVWTLMRLRRNIHVISKEMMEALYPRRNFLSYPTHAAEIGIDPETQGRLFELYPYPADTSEIVHYPYWGDPPTLTYRDPLPGYISEHILKEGVIASLLRRDGLAMMRAGQTTEGQALMNESRRQETFWRGKMIEAVIDEGALDDSSIIVYAGHPDNRREDVITTAYDQAWFGGS